MSSLARRASLLSGAATLLLSSLGSVVISQDAAAQAAPAGSTTLPEIVVRAPSPIVHRARPKPQPASASRTPAPPEPAAPPVKQADLPGTLRMVTAQFATVTVVPNDEIRRTGAATLGDLLNNKPGITGSLMK